ncbi:MAG TPA: VLRF1 family aeRF1-type release factor, partial [Candidatus Nitrosotenuis sp.]|nr:VLRF1 family aeRF1-type release factor [Candidatus Nitrosotenuis sp.]
FANRLVVNDVPRVYPLAVLLDSYRPCAVVLTNSQQARIYTVILGKIQESASLENPYEPLQRPGRGHTGPRGFQPELKFQRHFEQHAHHHLREVLETLERIVREENLQHLVLGGEEQALAELRRMLPKHLQEKVLDIVEMDVHTPEREVLRETLKILQERMAREGERKVETLLAESLAGGLAAVGVPATLNALNLGNVSELLLADNLSGKAYFCQGCQLLFEESAQDGRCQSCQGPLEPLDLVEALTAQARRIDAAINLIQGSEELRRVGGVGAFLRYRLAPAEEEKITTQTS